MIRKILGFLPVGMGLFALFIGGANFDSPDGAWSIARIPLNAWIWFGLSVLSGVLLCFDGLIPVGLIVGSIPYAYLFIITLTAGTYSSLIYPGAFLLFYIIYAACYYTYNNELNKP
ncbi:MAG: hypothetical protein J6I42_09595 [Clostridia bacterium]|nr:hypothetical protein [Clostridia bacterium]MBO5257740.1 hypothetical protein [Clostridia bacterium]